MWYGNTQVLYKHFVFIFHEITIILTASFMSYLKKQLTAEHKKEIEERDQKQKSSRRQSFSNLF